MKRRDLQQRKVVIDVMWLGCIREGRLDQTDRDKVKLFLLIVSMINNLQLVVLKMELISILLFSLKAI